MTVKELLDLLSTQPGDYEVTVRYTDHEECAIEVSAITGIGDVMHPEPGGDLLTGVVELDYEGNEYGEPDNDASELTEGEFEQEDEESIIGPDGREWNWEQFVTWVISLTIRNRLEMFHGGGAMDPEKSKPESVDESEGFITDRQMKALNIVIRHAVYEIISAMRDPDRVIDEEHGYTNALILDRTLWYINKYMEPPGSPELEEAYQRIKNGQFDPPGFVPDCARPSPES